MYAMQCAENNSLPLAVHSCMHVLPNSLLFGLAVLGASLYKSDTDRFRKDWQRYFVWWKGKDLKVYHFDSQ